MGILDRVSVPRFAGRGDGAKADGAGGKASAAVMEDRRKHKRTPAEDEAVAEFRRLLAEMLGEPAPEDSAEPEPETETAGDHASTETAVFAFPAPSEAGEVTDTLPDPFPDTLPDPFPESLTDGFTETLPDPSADTFLDGESADPAPATPLQEDTTDAREEDKVNPTSVLEQDPIIEEDLAIDDEQQITPVSVDRERVRIDLKDGRRLEAWRRTSPSTDQRLLIMDVIAVFDSQGKEIPSTPADSFIFRSEVIAINGSRPGNTSPNHQTPEEKERF